MKTILKFIVISLLGTQLFAQANNNCGNATLLTSNAATLCGQSINTSSTVQGGEYIGTFTCNSWTLSQSVWYRFVATSSNMYVELEVQSASGSNYCANQLSATLYNSASCFPGSGSIINCEGMGTYDGSIVFNTTGLTVGNTYLLQIGNSYDALCNVTFGDFCIRVGNTPAACSCASPCTSGCGYATPPSVATVTSTCPEYVLNPISDGGDTKTYCYDFTAIDNTVSFGMIITSNCTSGNVTGFTWNIKTSACGADVASGNLSNLSASGLSIGVDYVFCATYTIPTSCHHSSLYPYFVGAATVLPVEMVGLKGYNEGESNVITWTTVSENNNDYFILERSVNGVDFSALVQLDGAGNSEDVLQYTLYDTEYRNVVNYYRLVQVDFNGARTTSNIISIDNTLEAKRLERTINLLGQEVGQNYNGLVIEIYTDGSQRKTYKQ